MRVNSGSVLTTANTDSGTIILESGQSRGDGGSTVEIKTIPYNQGSGTTVRAAQKTLSVRGEELRLHPTDDPTDYIGLKAPTSTTSYTVSLPSAAPSAGQVLQASSATALTWTSPASALPIWSGYHTNASAWATTSTTYVDLSAGSPTLTESQNRSMGTVSTADSSLCGIKFTPPATGLYRITAHVSVLASTALYGSLRMTDGSANVLDPGRAINISSNNWGHMHLSALYNATSLSAVTIKLQGATSTGTFQVYTGPATGSAAIQWILEAV
jgi:hypothetical protein